MAKFETEFDQPYNITPDTSYFWNAFIKHTEQGNPLAAISVYHEFFEARHLNFIK